MLIKCDPKLVTSFSVNMGNNQIVHTNCTKYLGIIIDDKLSWYQHITNLEDKLAQSLGILHNKTLSDFFCTKVSLLVVFTRNCVFEDVACVDTKL